MVNECFKNVINWAIKEKKHPVYIIYLVILLITWTAKIVLLNAYFS